MLPVAAQARSTAALYPAERSAHFAGIVMDAKTGDVLYDRHADAERYPASISKLMTFYLAFEEMAAGRLKSTDVITVSPHAAAQPKTNLGMYAGERITVQNALLGMAVHSANDMAMAMAEKIGGTQAGFAVMMNRKAHELGMAHSFFDNPNGLPDPRQVSTARDLAVLCRAIQRDFPQYYSVFDTRSFSYHGRTMRNTNHLLGVVAGVDGIKTGTTNAAGHNIAISGVRDGRRMIVIVLGAPSGPASDITA
jgi:D-alanyl-D-alanine carboxypeptidase